MKRTLSLILTSTMGVLLLQGCAHSAMDRQIDEKIAQDTTTKTRADLTAHSEARIETAPGLTSEQRAKLLDLRAKTRAQLDELGAQSLKLRGLLIHDVISANYDQNEVQAVKVRLKDLENKRLTVMFDSVDEANSILGRQALEHSPIMNSFFQQRQPTSSD